jgi:hypothetical protein
MYLARVRRDADTVTERTAGGLRLRYGRWSSAPVARSSPTGGLAEPLRLENRTTIVPGDRVTHLVYDVCTG